MPWCRAALRVPSGMAHGLRAPFARLPDGVVASRAAPVDALSASTRSARLRDVRAHAVPARRRPRASPPGVRTVPTMPTTIPRGASAGAGAGARPRPRVPHVAHTRASRLPSASADDTPASSPAWWDLGARFEAFSRLDQRSEYGYMEHDSPAEVLFERESDVNGVVRVVAHGPWRSLRFNDVEQGLTYVTENPDGTFRADVDVLGYEYLRCMTAAAAANGALAGPPLDLRGDGSDPGSGSASPPPRVICVGLGSGALPAFIARKFPRCVVEVVEIDPVVAEAVAEHHGVSTRRRAAAMGAANGWGGDAGEGPGLGVVMGDAGVFMASAAAAVTRGDAPPAAVIFLDAYDGEGRVPAHLSSPEFLDACAEAAARGGAVVANVFNGAEGTPQRANAEAYARELARRVGAVTSFAVEPPVNVVFVATRGAEAGGASAAASLGPRRFTRRELKEAAKTLGEAAGFEWDAGERVRRAYWVDAEGSRFAETPAGTAANPLAKLMERVGTTMPYEWVEENDPGYNPDVQRGARS